MIARLHNNRANKLASGFVQCHSSSSSPTPSSSRLSSIRRPQLTRRRRATLLKLAKYCSSIPTAAAPVTMIKSTPVASTSRISLPAYLPMPALPEVDAQALRKACPELGDMPLSYTRDGLQHLSTHMYAGVQSATPQHSKSQLPHELQVLLSDPISQGSIIPTHVLAISSSAPQKAGTPKKVTLFPAHQLVLGANCARLPAFPPSATAVRQQPHTSGASNEVTMPVVRLALPAPEHFPALMWYLYMKDVAALRRGLLSPGSAADIASVMRRVRMVHGLWANACALGVVDAPLYAALEEAWQLILQQLAIATTAQSSSS